MTDEKIERVARAIAIKVDGRNPDDLVEYGKTRTLRPYWIQYTDIAKAAIAAMEGRDGV